jgi:hypothetical protein
MSIHNYPPEPEGLGCLEFFGGVCLMLLFLSCMGIVTWQQPVVVHNPDAAAAVAGPVAYFLKGTK